MGWAFDPRIDALPLFLGVVLLLVLNVLIWTRRQDRVSTSFGLMLLAILWWLLAYMLEILSDSDSALTFWSVSKFAGVVFVAPLFLVFSLAFCKLDRWITPRNLILVFTVPVVTLLLILTNESHQLFWQYVSIEQQGAVLRFVTVDAIWALVHGLYGLLLAGITGALLYRRFRVSHGNRRRQFALLLWSWALPLIAYFWTGSSLNPWPELDLMPFSLVISAGLLALSLYRYRFMDVMPLASDAIFRAMRGAFLVCDVDGVIVNANPAALRMCTLLEGATGQPFKQVFASMPQFIELLENTDKDQDVITFGGRVLEVRVFALESRNRAPEGWVIMFWDVSERVSSEARVRRLSAAVEQSANIIIITNPEGNIEYVNPQFSMVTGYLSDEVVGRNPRFLKSGETTDETYQKLWNAISTGQQWQGELHNRKKSGELYWVRSTISPVFDDLGEVTSFMAIQEDITLRKEAEAREREQRQFAEALSSVAAITSSTLNLSEVLDRVLYSIQDTLSVPFDMASVMLIEDGVARIVQYHVDSDQGVDDEYLKSVRLVVEETASLSAVVASNSVEIIADVQDYAGWVPGATSRDFRSVILAPIQSEGQVIGFLNLDSAQPDTFTPEHGARLQALADQAAVAIRNAQLFERVRAYTSELEERNSDLDDFAHTVAHDLRAPLSLIIGYLALVDTTDERYVEIEPFISTAANSAEKMNAIIDGLLLLAQVRRDKVEMSTVPMNQVVEDAIARFQGRGEELAVRIEVQPDLPEAHGYGPWVEEVFANLISNSIKYIGKDNQAPMISIRGAAHGNIVQYEVEDNGLGISSENQKRLFEMFTRFHQDEASGTGLGLSIVLRILNRLGGDIGVDSEVGRGSTVWFTLPAPALGYCITG